MDPRNAWDAGGAEEGEMGIDQGHGLDAATSERLLAGERVGPPALVRLLAAAAAPPFPQETAGEDVAAMAFRTARSQPVREGTPRPAVARRAALLWIKTVAAVSVAVAAAGAALAAGTGVLPNPFDRPAPSTATPGSSHPQPSLSDPRSAGGSTGVVPSTPGPGGPPATVPAAMDGLCRVYLAQEERAPGQAASSPAFATLVAAAGGPEHVVEYCATLLGPDAVPPGLASPRPTQTPAGPAPQPGAAEDQVKTPPAPATGAGS
jgi:hypothetical protein